MRVRADWREQEHELGGWFAALAPVVNLEAVWLTEMDLGKIDSPRKKSEGKRFRTERQALKSMMYSWTACASCESDASRR